MFSPSRSRPSGQNASRRSWIWQHAPTPAAGPGVVYTFPSDGQIDVPLGARIVITFSGPVVANAPTASSSTPGAERHASREVAACHMHLRSQGGEYERPAQRVVPAEHPAILAYQPRWPGEARGRTPFWWHRPAGLTSCSGDDARALALCDLRCHALCCL